MSQKTLDTLLVATIQQVAEDRIQKGEMFTAFDVSRQVQNLGHRERHSNMKHVVHELYESGQMAGYDRTLVSVESGKPDAWVYHPTGTDPNTYVSTAPPLPSSMTPQSFYQQGATPTPTTTPNPSLTSVSFVPPLAGKHRPDARGAMTVPASLIRTIGAKPGDVLYVSEDKQSNSHTLVIDKSGPSGWAYHVNSSGNIRIKKKRWSLIQIPNGQFGFEENQGRIVVKCG